MTNRPEDESQDKEPGQDPADEPKDTEGQEGPKDRFEAARRFWTDPVGRPDEASGPKPDDAEHAGPSERGHDSGGSARAARQGPGGQDSDRASAARSAEEFLASADEIFAGLRGKGAGRGSGSSRSGSASAAPHGAKGADKPPRGPNGLKQAASGPRKPGPLVLTLSILAIVGVMLAFFADTWTEVLWFNQLGFSRVIWTRWGTKGALLVLGTLVMAAGVWASVAVARRARVDVPTDPSARNLAAYRDLLDPMWRVLVWAVPVVTGLLAALWELVPSWDRVLLAMSSQPFGVKDPQFGLDVSFYVFELPVIRMALGFLTSTVVLSAVAGVAVHYLYGGISLQRRPHVTRSARFHLTLLLALYSLLRGLGYWLGRYEALSATNTKFDGAAYTDVNAVLPALAILAAIAVAISALFIVSLRTESWRLPITGVVVMVASALVVGWAYPAVVQQFVVEPNAQTEEAPYIQRNIDATLAAYGLDKVEATAYDARTTAEAGQLKEDAESTTSIRLLDPNLIAPTFQQLQQNKQYYSFASSLNVDRYHVDGNSRDTVIAVRELNLAGLEADQQSWVNAHTVYTHGFGVVTAYGNTVASGGSPSFWEGGIPSQGDLGDYEPRIYFGRQSPSYSIVGGSDGALSELDYPDDASANGQVNTSFDGDGGPDVGGLWNKILYAVKFREVNILFSSQVSTGSQILYDRDPVTRVAKAAPWLTLDANPYPAVVDHDDNPATPKRVLWVVDGYTTSNEYPYSEHESLADSVTDSTGGKALLGAPEQSNYVRNSVKAVVDAYDGSVKLYQWDGQDPLLAAWEKVFPGSVTPMSEMSADLMAHMRYPEDLFKVQRTIMARYHVKDAAEFYSAGDFWKVPDDPIQQGDAPQAPYYLTLKMPGQDQASFSLSSVYIIGGNTNRNVLTGFLAVDSETATGERGKRAESYGRLRLLELPRSSNVSGPGQVQNNFDSDETASKVINLLSQQGSQVIKGNLLTLPVGGGLLYVQPVYVQSSAGTQFPLLRKVLVSFGDKVGFADTLSQALDLVFEGDSGATTGEQVVDGDSGSANDTSDSGGTAPGDADAGAAAPVTPAAPEQAAAPTAPGATQAPSSSADPKADLDQALSDAKSAMDDADAAMKSGDWAKYGEAQKRLTDALNRAVDAQGRLDR